MRSRSRRVSLICGVVLLLAACSNTPATEPTGSPPPPSSTSAEDMSQIVVGVDSVLGGYNPHNLADASSVTMALAQLLLPSVFRPSLTDPAGPPTLDENLMRSAEVISEQPFKVAYEIRQDASWSDGAPIAVEDFIYLADAMRNEPGTAQPAGYRLISGIQPGEGGKRVEVTFSKPYPGWRTLFSNLLPAHLLKDAPGGWKGALANGFSTYGGPFAIKTLDADRGEIILERNERYWERPAVINRLVLRRADQPGLADALRNGTNQLAVARTDSAGVALLNELGAGVQLHNLANPRVAQAILRPVGVLSNTQVRTAIGALIDRNKLIEEGAKGGPSANLRADAQVISPAEAGYRSTFPGQDAPGSPNLAKAQEALSAAGYTKEAGTWRKDGKALSLVVASPGEQEPYASMAKSLASQLIAAGIEVRVVNPPSRELFANQLAMPLLDDSGTSSQPQSGSGVGVDIAVIPQSVGGDPASVLASNFGCRTDEEEITPTVAALPANPAAFCDPHLQPLIEAALTGAKPVNEVLSTVESDLWRQSVVIPLFQLADTLAIGSGVSGVFPGPPLTGPFGSAINWTRGVTK